MDCREANQFLVKDWSKWNRKWNPYRTKLIRYAGVTSAFVYGALGIWAWSVGLTGYLLLLAPALISLMLVILAVKFPVEEGSLEQVQRLLPQERELAVFKNVRALSGNYSFIADLHLTESRIFVTPNDQTKKRFLKVANRLSIDLAQVTRVSFHRRKTRFGAPTLTIHGERGSHFWNRFGFVFALSDETFEEARRIFPSMISLAGKVEV